MDQAQTFSVWHSQAGRELELNQTQPQKYIHLNIYTSMKELSEEGPGRPSLLSWVQWGWDRKGSLWMGPGGSVRVTKHQGGRAFMVETHSRGE